MKASTPMPSRKNRSPTRRATGVSSKLPPSNQPTRRTAATILSEAGVPAARIPDTLRELRNAMSFASSLAVGQAVTSSRRKLPTGARNSTGVSRPRDSRKPSIIDARASGAKTASRRSASQEARIADAESHFNRALALEESDVAAARHAYTTALVTYGGHLEARINLGRLLHLDGELEMAEKVYRDAKQASATLSFNLALLLEDLHRDEESARAYRDALALDPSLHEAHFNLSVLHERHERPREALRHMLAFRRNTQR